MSINILKNINLINNMKIIHPYVDLIQQEPGFDGIMKHIERCGRTCYKSEDKITDDSADTFVANLIKNKHYAMLEHGTVYLRYLANPYEINPNTLYHNYTDNPYSVVIVKDGYIHVTTNYRVLQENDWLDDLQFICEPTEFHIPRITLKFITNIGVTREGNRMRANSIAEESTRYCNYTKNKFGKEITFTAPVWLSPEQRGNFNAENVYMGAIQLLECGNYKPEECSELVYLSAIAYAELHYNTLIRLGWTPQQAREVLPLATKSEVVYTAFPHQWKHFFDLRLFGTTGKPHPNMQEIAELAQGVLEENGLWELIYPSDDKIQ